MTLSYHRTDIASKELLLNLGRQKFKETTTPVADYVDYVKTTLPYFKMLNWNIMSIDGGFITSLSDDNIFLKDKIASDVNNAKLGHSWLSNVCHSFSSAIEHASHYNDYFKGPLNHHISLLLLDEYLRQSENYFSEGKSGIFYKSKHLMPVTLPSNRMFKKALLLWKEMQNGNRDIYIPYDGKIINQLYNKGMLSVSSTKVDRNCYIEAQNISEVVREVCVNAFPSNDDFTSQAKRELLERFDNDPYYACLFVSKVTDAFFSWESGCQYSVDELLTIKKECSTLTPLTLSLCSMIKWVIKNTPDVISSMINHMMLSSSNFIEQGINRFGSTLPECHNRLFIDTNLSFNDAHYRDGIIMLMGLSDNSLVLSQAAKVFNTCYEYLQKMEKWSLQNSIKYPIKDIALNKNVEYFYKYKGFDSLAEYRNYIKASCVQNWTH